MIIEHFFFYRWNELAILVYVVYCGFPTVVFQTKSSVQSTIAYLKFLFDLNHSSRRFSWLYHYQQKGIDIQFLKIDPRQKNDDFKNPIHKYRWWIWHVLRCCFFWKIFELVITIAKKVFADRHASLKGNKTKPNLGSRHSSRLRRWR